MLADTILFFLVRQFFVCTMMEISFTGISASHDDAAALATRTSSFPSSEHSRKRKHSCEVATALSAVVAPAAAANGDHSIWESSKRSRVVEELNPEWDSTVQPTCLLHKSRFAKRVFVRGKQSSHCAKVVCALCRRNAISRQWVPSLDDEEEFAHVKAKLIKELGLFDSDSVIPGIYQDPDSNGQVQPQVFERWGHSQIDADVQFTWPSLENEEEFAEVKAKLMKGLGLFESGALITGIYRDSSPRGRARLQAFERQEQLTREARGHANVQYAWHGTSKTGVSGIILHGFGQPRTPTNGSAYGVGVYLAPENHADVSAVYADDDKNGEQHILLCRVILGAAELVVQGSDQFHPSSEHFDTGADDLFAPKRLIVWSTHMNTHILPLYVVSFKLAPRWRALMAEFKGKQRGISRTWKEVPAKSSFVSIMAKQPSEEWCDHVGGIQRQVVGPTSPCVSFPGLFVILRQQLAAEDLYFLEQQHVAFKAGRLPREQLIKVCRDVAGDAKLLSAIQQLTKRPKVEPSEIKPLTYLSAI